MGSATVGTSTQATEGTTALKLSGAGWAQLTSAPMATSVLAGSQVSLDIKLPKVLSWGALELVLQAPSASLWWSSLGTTQLGGKSANQFHTLTFPVSEVTRQALTTGANDLRILVIVNIESNAGDVLLDRFQAFGVPEDEPPVDEGPYEVVVQLPLGLGLNEVLLSAEQKLVVDDRVTLGSTGELEEVAGFGGVEVGAGVQARATIRSGAGVAFLRSQSHVFGDVLASGLVTQQNNVVVDGTTRSHAAVGSETRTWPVTWPEGSAQDVHLEPDASSAIEPGLHGDVTVKSRATLTLAAGSYFLDSLVIDPQAHVQMKTDAGPVTLHIKERLR
ncbi:MAG TPA: hypothetical protein VN764_08295, partial [Polyangiaceae bacterium]|nr:hypothetical protein [Polyangiaceae bacterium]